MKKSILFFIGIISLFTLQAQNSDIFVYLIDNFQPGTVTFKSGMTSEGILNYEMRSQKIHFLQNNDTLELSHPESVRIVAIGNRILECMKGGDFYERIPFDDIDLYLKHSVLVNSKGKNSGYGGRSQTSAIENIGWIPTASTYLKLERDELYEIQKKCSFYIKANGKLRFFNSLSSFSKIFKGYEKKIKDGLSRENLDFSDPDDVKKAVWYCVQLVSDK